MRGAPVIDECAGAGSGIIPAYAGSTGATRQSARTRRDHPRVCGEHMPSSRASAEMTGSSPRMRGARLADVLRRRLQGIIPAYAGSTPATPATACAASDHPRVCGEHSLAILSIVTALGSSPRMRGARPAVRLEVGAHGIIPAYAGSTLHEVHRFDSKVQFVYGCQGSVHCSVLQLFIPTGTGRGRQVRNADVLPLARSYLPYFLAALNLLALLQPVGGIPSSLASSVPLGLLISSTPSQSTGSQSG